MAVAYDNDTGTASNAAGGTVSVTHTCSGSNRAVFVGAYFDIQTTVGAITTTYAGNTASGEPWDVAGQNTSRQNGAYFKEAVAPTGAQTASATSAITGTVFLKAMVAVSFTGVDQTTSVGTAPTPHQAATGTTPTVTVAGTVAGGMIVDWLCGYSSGSTATVGADQTEQFKSWGVVSASALAASSTQDSAAGGVMSWTKASNFEFILGAVEFKPAPVAAVVSTPRLTELIWPLRDRLFGRFTPIARRKVTPTLPWARLGKNKPRVVHSLLPATGPVGLVNKTLAAAAGSYVLTGSAASLLHRWIVPAAAGSYAFTGTAASPLHNWRPAAAAGSYVLTGTAASLLHRWVVSAAAGSYTFTGSAATLRRNLPLVAGAGSYALTGTAASLLHAWRPSAAAGSYAFTGSAVSLLHKWVVTAGVGSYAFTGSAASTLHNWKVAAAPGSYAFTGSAASLLHAWKVTAGSGSYNFTGSSVTLTYSGSGNKTLAAGAGSYVFTGAAASTLHNWIVAAGAGSYAFTGSAVTLRAGKSLAAAPGSYAFTGTAAGVLFTRLVTAGAGSYAFTGTAANLNYSPLVVAKGDTGGSGHKKGGPRYRRNINDDSDAYAELLEEWAERLRSPTEHDAPEKLPQTPAVAVIPPIEPDEFPALVERMGKLEDAFQRNFRAFERVEAEQAQQQAAALRAIEAAEAWEAARQAYEQFLEDEEDDDFLMLVA